MSHIICKISGDCSDPKFKFVMIAKMIVFLINLLEEESADIDPVFLDFKNDIVTSQVGDDNISTF